MSEQEQSGNATPPLRSTSRSTSLRHAASILVVRDGAAGMEVLLVRRAERNDDRSSGAFVFPGGTLDPQDKTLHALCTGLDDALASQRLGLPDGGLDFYLAAVRECFEEAGLLFASDAGSRLIALDQLDAQQHDWYRQSARRGGPGMAQLCERLHVRLAVDRLAYHSHWLTPPGLPKRFDTRFFVAVAPAGQTAAHDGDEAVEHLWVRPADAIDAARGLKLVPVTRRTLASIARFDSAQACFDHAAQLRDIVRIMPRLALGSGGPRPVLPSEPAYPEIERIDPHGEGHARYELAAGVPVRLSDRIWRVTANNGSVMTGPGTNTYFVGDPARNEWAVIDPGPDDETHVAAVLAAAPGPIRWILATHTHLDHSPATPRLKAATGAPVLGRAAPPASRQDQTFQPDRILAHGERLVLGSGSTLRVVHTPGHASNHLCFLLEEEKTLFTGDHVMQGSTVVINPPDGDMQAYLASLAALQQEDLEWLAPGHGFLMARPGDAIRTLIRHRMQREAKVLNALRELGESCLDALLLRVYDDVPERMHPVAQRSLLAHLHKLALDGRAVESGQKWQLAAENPAG
ncbi:MBL fold metallo-hydrolase [Cupriavidus basilensis]|uniref:MBL fold metallo-hydrolase n=1 Tax=Cupriavidus basilensis TaxID=68895 RepID=A0ABT6AVC7_9BURK|nr:MBL fold metallo-hydrolase [Cupriavidus basilensis]MDF3836538.1 MBL fold metallo-hydrolase [Cupriavidus basilensis]